jgi:hypothetical protein
MRTAAGRVDHCCFHLVPIWLRYLVGGIHRRERLIKTIAAVQCRDD